MVSYTAPSILYGVFACHWEEGHDDAISFSVGQAPCKALQQTGDTSDTPIEIASGPWRPCNESPHAHHADDPNGHYFKQSVQDNGWHCWPSQECHPRKNPHSFEFTCKKTKLLTRPMMARHYSYESSSLFPGPGEFSPGLWASPCTGTR
jgi:hypothetical protein